MSAEFKMSLPLRTVADAEPRARRALEAAHKSLGFVPNMYAGMANSPGLLETYLQGYQLFRQESGFTPVEQEVVFLTVSRSNGCRYCVAAHSLIADQMSKVPVEVTDAIRNGTPIADAKLAALSSFTRTMVETRGLPSHRDVDAFLSAGYAERQILEIILAIAVKTLSNYSNHLFQPSVDAMFASRSWTP
jgi:uncharacterized peroxidase-related enzyme